MPILFRVAAMAIVGGVASALNRTAVEAVAIVAGSPSGLIGSTGSLAERDDVAKIMQDQDVVLVADLTACVLLDALGVLRDGQLAERKLAVPQTTLDELLGEGLKWQTPRRDGFLSVGLHEGQLGLIRFLGHFERGGYDGPDDGKRIDGRRGEEASSAEA